MLISDELEKGPDLKIKTKCSTEISINVDIYSVICYESLSFVFVIGYFILGCVGHYWFRRKYNCHSELASTTLKFMVVFMIQAVAIISMSVMFILTYFSLLIEGTNWIIFVSKNVMPLVRVIFPCIFILRANKICFDEDTRFYARSND